MSNKTELSAAEALKAIETTAREAELQRQLTGMSNRCVAYAAEVEKANAIIAAKDAQIKELEEQTAALLKTEARAVVAKRR